MKKERATKAVIYARIAATTVANKFGCLSEQIKQCEKYCIENNMEVTGHYSEIGSTKSIMSLKGTMLGVAVDECRKQNASLIITNPTRITRNMTDLIRVKMFIESTGITVRFAVGEERYDLIDKLLSNLADTSRSIHSESVKEAIRRKKLKIASNKATETTFTEQETKGGVTRITPVRNRNR